MAHVFAFVEGRKTWFDLFLNDLNKRRYEYSCIDGNRRFIQPNAREIHLMNISVPKDAVPQLLSDLSPFAYRAVNTVSEQKDAAAKLAKALRVMGGFRAIYPEFDKPTKWVKVPFVGKYLDKVARFFREDKPFEEYKPSGELRHKWINVIPIGIKDDWCHPESEVKGLPKGGELI